MRTSYHENAFRIIGPLSEDLFTKGPIMRGSVFLLLVLLAWLLSKRSSGRWFESHWHSCDVIVRHSFRSVVRKFSDTRRRWASNFLTMWRYMYLFCFLRDKYALINACCFPIWGACPFCTPVLILGLRTANERRRYFVTTSLIGWAPAYNQPCTLCTLSSLWAQCMTGREDSTWASHRAIFNCGNPKPFLEKIID